MRFLLRVIILILWMVCPSLVLASDDTPKKIGISQIVEHPALDSVRLGLLAGLAEQGFEEGKNLTVLSENAQGNLVTSTQIATKLLSASLDVVVAISTPSAQSLLFAAERNNKRVPIVFTAVSDPVSAKLEPGKSMYPITGITDTPDLEQVFEVMSKMLPQVKKVGILYNAAESNSVSTVTRFKKLLQMHGIGVRAVTVNSTGNIEQAMLSLVDQVDALYFPQDNTVVSAIETVVSIAKQPTTHHPKGLPVFCNDPLLVKRGVLVGVGFDYTELGRETGKRVGELLKGADIKAMPIKSLAHSITVINKPLAQKMGLTVPPSKLAKPITIGVVVPMDHMALREIVAGFKQVVTQQYPHPVVFNVQNAQGDIKLQRSIVELFMGQKVDLIVPIGTTTTQMTLSLVKEQPIVSLAALFSEADRKKRNPRNITGVLDEIGGKKKLDFMRSIIPNLKMITILFHSGNEKIFPEVEELVAYGKQIGIKVQTIAIQALPDLSMAAQSISPQSEAILILKDHLVASGIRLLVPLAENRHIPLITSDEGSIHEGGSFALGVPEKMIGVEGGKLAVKVLEGTPIATLPMQPVKTLAIFYNPTALDETNINKRALQNFAKRNRYLLIATDYREQRAKK